MPTKPRENLFELLRVDREADDRAIHDAYVRFIAAADGNEAALDPWIKRAYGVLASEESRVAYLELLTVSEKKTDLKILPEIYEDYKRFCDDTFLTLFPHPRRPNIYRVCHAGQAVPSWINYDEEKMPLLHMSGRQRLIRWLRLIFLLEIFAGRTFAEKFWLVLAYVLVIFLGVRSVGWVRASVASWEATRMEADARSAKGESDALLAAASSGLKDLAQKLHEVEEDFHKLVGVSLDDAQPEVAKRIPDLDGTFARHSSVREAWKLVFESKISKSELASANGKVTALEQRFAGEPIDAAGREEIKGIEHWVQTSLESLKTQRSNIEHVRIMLETDRFEREQGKARSSP